MKTEFSFYKIPITNTVPYKIINLKQVYDVITDNYFEKETIQLRTICDKKENQNYKRTHFPSVTFSGIFERRHGDCLIKHSGLLALDFDDLEDVEGFKLKLLNDIAFPTELLFVSPNGNGLKWVICIGDCLDTYSHDDLAVRVFRYIEETYSVEVDKNCKDLSRATFLCYDAKAFIHPKYLTK